MKKNNCTVSEKLMDLSGIWNFAFTKAPIADISVTEMRFDSLAAVPGCYDLLPGCKFKRGTGVYCRTVNISGPVELTLHGIGLRGAVYWDGEKKDEIDAPFSKRVLRFDAGAPGDHQLVIAVNNEFDTHPSSLFKTNYDFYAHGGIYRKVTIAPATAVYPDFVKVLPLDIEAGTVEVDLQFLGAVEGSSAASLAWDGNAATDEITLENGRGKGTFKVPSPRIWSPESPELHTLTIKTGDCEYTTRFGLRKVTAADGKLFLNGKRIKIAGTNRHDAHPDFGYAVPMDIRLRDLLMLKQQGFNCIRGCHYPQDEEFLDLCDDMGMLVWEESLGWGNKEPDLADPLFRERQLRETERMVKKSINHPCVIMWGFLNECDSNFPVAREIIAPIAQMLRKADPSRPVTFGSHRLTKDLCLDLIDIISFNTYPCWYGDGVDQYFEKECLINHLEKLAEFASSPEFKDKPLIISEIGAEALPGDHSGMRWSEEYQAELLSATMRHVLETDRFTGTFLWQFCDIRTYINNACQVRTGGFNHKGMVDGSRMPKISWNEVGKTIRECLNKSC